MSGKHAGNQHKAHDCPYCWLVYYSQGALTTHINNEHWEQREKEDADMNITILQGKVVIKDVAA